MPAPFVHAYWKSLRKSWQDTFVMNIIHNFNDPDYVLELAQKAGIKELGLQINLEKLGVLQSGELGWKIYDSIWQTTFGKIQEISGSLDFQVDEIPLIGTLATGKINALAIMTPGKEAYILAFEVGLFQFMAHISDYVAIHLEPNTSKKKQTSFSVKSEINTELSAGLVRMMLNYYQDGIPFLNGYTRLQNEQQHTLSTGLRNILKLFVAGHEYAHIGLGHLKVGKQFIFHLAANDHCTVSSPDSFQQEHEADQGGLLIALTYYLKKGMPYWFSGALIIYFLTFSSFIYKGLSVIIGSPIKDLTHPSFESRIDFLENVLFELISKEEQKIFFAMKGFYEGLLIPFESLFMEELAKSKDTLTLASVWQGFVAE